MIRAEVNADLGSPVTLQLSDALTMASALGLRNRGRLLECEPVELGLEQVW